MTTVFRDRAEEITHRHLDFSASPKACAREIEALCVQVHNEVVEKARGVAEQKLWMLEELAPGATIDVQARMVGYSINRLTEIIAGLDALKIPTEPT